MGPGPPMAEFATVCGHHCPTHLGAHAAIAGKISRKGSVDIVDVAYVTVTLKTSPHMQ